MAPRMHQAFSKGHTCVRCQPCRETQHHVSKHLRGALHAACASIGIAVEGVAQSDTAASAAACACCLAWLCLACACMCRGHSIALQSCTIQCRTQERRDLTRCSWESVRCRCTICKHKSSAAAADTQVLVRSLEHRKHTERWCPPVLARKVIQSLPFLPILGP